MADNKKQEKLTPEQKVVKRMKAHSQTVGVWLASTTKRNEGEDDRAYAERLITLGAWHAMQPCNAPLLRKIVNVLGKQNNTTTIVEQETDADE